MTVRIKLNRYFQGNATMGVLSCDLLPCNLFTLELPWKNNQKLISCIPAGIYKFSPHGWDGEPVNFPKTWILEDVPNRDDVLIHIGNYLKNTKGCILIGRGLSITPNLDCSVISSASAVDLFRTKIGKRSGVIEIVDGFK